MKTKMQKYQKGGRTVNQVRTKGTDPLSYYSPAKKSGSGNLIPATRGVAKAAKKAVSKMKTGGMVNANSKIVADKTPGSKGTKVGLNKRVPKPGKKC